MLQLDTKYVVFALVVVVVVSAIYFNTKLTNVETLVLKHDQFNMHIGDAFKPIHQKYSEHESRINNIDDTVKSLRNRLNVIPPQKRRNSPEDEDDDILNKMKSTS